MRFFFFSCLAEFFPCLFLSCTWGEYNILLYHWVNDHVVIFSWAFLMGPISSFSLIHACIKSWKTCYNILALSFVMGPLGIEIFSPPTRPMSMLTSSSPSSKRFVLESEAASKRERLETLKVVDTPYSPGRSIL